MPPALEPRIQSVEERLNRFGERLAAVETKTNASTPQKETNWYLVTMLSIVGAMSLAFWGWVGNNILGLNKDVATISQKLADVEKLQTQNLLTAAQQAAKLGDQKTANDLLKQTADMVKQLAETHTHAEQDFFTKAVEKLDQMSGVDQNVVQATLISFAHYRSALNAPPSLPDNKKNAPPPPAPVRDGSHPVLTTVSLPGGAEIRAVAWPIFTTMNFSPAKPITLVADGAVVDARGERPDQQLLVVATRSLDQNPAIVQGLTVIGGNQTLDYITWHNVTFISTHIKYDGGPVRLNNVRFINCTFDFPSNSLGLEVAKYCILEPKEPVTVG
ncbi:MAG: hypothetical protein ACJ71Q_22165 [Terriglobales bacterium]